MSRTSLEFNRPGLFVPQRVRRILDDTGAVLKKNASDLEDSNILSTSSFRYDPPSMGIRSTQQIPTDFSKFENHTFFSSAEVNVNVAFDRIINEYPFDGTRKEIEEFLDTLTGFEKYVFDKFPRNGGYLFFSGSHIVVNDSRGAEFSSITRNATGGTVLDPVDQPFTIEMYVFIPQEVNDNQILCQKISGSMQGITLALSQSTSTTTCDVVFGAISGSRNISVTAPIEKGQFKHLVATFDRRPLVNSAKIFLDNELVSTSIQQVEMGQIDFNLSPLTIGSGTTHDNLITPVEVFSGALDELRIFHSIRGEKQQKMFAKKSIYASPELKLYFKFNEPFGSTGQDSLVLDYSGNGLHSVIQGFNSSLRNTGSMAQPITFENESLSLVLFPGFDGVRDLNANLLASATVYDNLNPNLITKLIPPHYFEEGRVFDSFDVNEGTIVDPIKGSGPPGSLDIGSQQLISSMLYVWAKFFDEIKMVIDLFGNTIFVDYDKPNNTADQFLPFLARWYGFEMPAIFNNSTNEQFFSAENIGTEFSTNSLSLRMVQNQIWRRILTNIGEIIRSKGTLHSISLLLHSLGVDHDQNFRIREFGGPTKRALENARENKRDIVELLSFSGTLASVADPENVNAFGVHANRPVIISSILSSSRVEIGFPEIQGSFVDKKTFSPHGISNNPSDGLFTSGSWTFEGLYRWPQLLTGSYPQSQSLVRMFSTGTLASAGEGILFLNVVAHSGSNVKLYGSFDSSPSISDNLLELSIPVDVMDGQLWNISFGRQRNDEIGSHVSSSYFLRAARNDFGSIIEIESTSSFYVEADTPGENVLQKIDAGFNSLGPILIIGSQSISTTPGVLLSDATSAPDDARVSHFSGRLGQLRFWSQALAEDEWKEHVRNPRSLGVNDPNVGFNFVKTATGSFGRLRIDASVEQPIIQSNSVGDIKIFDFSQNDFHLSGTGFEPSVRVVRGQRLFFSQLSPRFDEATTTNKVRVRSFRLGKNLIEFGGEPAPVYQVPLSDVPEDDVRFAIDFSVVDALNEDIIKIFSTLDELDNALGNPELVFSPDYPQLDVLRDIYFNRLTERVRLQRFFEFFKWFDSLLNVGYLIEQLIPRKTDFQGTSFVIESHMLERPKIEYTFSDIYLGDNNRNGLKGTILLQQFAASLRRF